MLPVAIGSQGRASTLRPASYCGAWALKPSWGAINFLGGLPTPVSTNHIGVLAGSVADMWITAYYLSQPAGGDPGHPSLAGGPALPAAQRPERLARVETSGWGDVGEGEREAFRAGLDRLAARDVEILDRDELARLLVE